nr:MAG TPA: hypothetical protein [Caudoviricetes sp.]
MTRGLFPCCRVAAVGPFTVIGGHVRGSTIGQTTTLFVDVCLRLFDSIPTNGM